MAIFFTSDTHFGHAGALGLYRRPFASIAAMDAAIVRRWNEAVGRHDHVWHLGDFALGPSEARMNEFLEQLHGHKHLVAGNNDSAVTKRLAGWTSVQPYAELEIDGLQDCLLFAGVLSGFLGAGALLVLVESWQWG